jgi:threonyl-tRNA synthetase
VPTTDRIKAFAVTKNSSAYWLGKKTNDDLQRVYGIAFPDKDQLKEYIQIQEDLAKRDHRNVGKQNQLFLFNPLSPGSAFFYPDGTHIYNRMMNFIRGQYNLRGF